MSASDIIASLALLISIFTYFSQKKGVKNELLITNICEYTKRYQEIIIRLPEDVLYNNFDIKNISGEKRELILRYMWLYFDLCYEEYSLYHNLKLVDKKLWKIWESGMYSALSRPAFYQSWKLIKDRTNYGNNRAFIQFMDEISRQNSL